MEGPNVMNDSVTLGRKLGLGVKLGRKNSNLYY
jgi:hypothetical protein